MLRAVLLVVLLGKTQIFQELGVDALHGDVTLLAWLVDTVAVILAV